jgi:hypothetical protein
LRNNPAGDDEVCPKSARGAFVPHNALKVTRVGGQKLLNPTVLTFYPVYITERLHKRWKRAKKKRTARRGGSAAECGACDKRVCGGGR